MPRAQSVVDVILGEAVSGTPQQRYQDMVAIASAMVNRANELGVPLEDVVSVQSEFNAYGKAMPAGADRYRDLAEQALTEVLSTGPVHPGSFYATPSAAGNLPGGLSEVSRTTGHVYFEDPHDRSIRTAQGFRSPVAQAYSAVPEPRPEPEAFAALLGPVESTFAAPAGRVERGSLLGPVEPAPSAGLLGSPAIEAPVQSAFPTSPAFDTARFSTGPVANGRSDLAKGLAASTPAFDMERFGPQIATPTAPSSFDVGRFAETAPVAQGQEGLLSAMQPAFDPGRFSAPSSPTLADPTRAGLQRGLLDQQLAVGILPDIPAPVTPAVQAINNQVTPGYRDPRVTTQPMPDISRPIAATPARSAVQQAAMPLEVQNGLLSPTEYNRVQDQRRSLASASLNYNRQARFEAAAKNALGTFGGALLGGALLGPVGGLLGGYLGRTISTGSARGFPSAPEGASRGDGSLTDYGRDALSESGQFRDSYDNGKGAGLW